MIGTDEAEDLTMTTVEAHGETIITTTSTTQFLNSNNNRNRNNNNVITNEQEQGQQTNNEQQRQQNVIINRVMLPQIHILVVDDERICRAVTSQVLRKCGYRVTTCSSGAEAIELLRRGTEFHLLLTDVMMPDIDGPKLLQHVRHHSQFSQLPVIMMSANQHSEVVFQCVRAGADDYLLKPVTMKQVKLLWQHVWRKQYSTAPQTVPSLNEHGEEIFDEEDERDCLTGNEEVFEGVPNVPMKRINSDLELLNNNNDNYNNNNNSYRNNNSIPTTTTTSMVGMMRKENSDSNLNQQLQNNNNKSFSRDPSRENFLSMLLSPETTNNNEGGGDGNNNNNNNNNNNDNNDNNNKLSTAISENNIINNIDDDNKKKKTSSRLHKIEEIANEETKDKLASNNDEEQENNAMEIDEILVAVEYKSVETDDVNQIIDSRNKKSAVSEKDNEQRTPDQTRENQQQRRRTIQNSLLVTSASNQQQQQQQQRGRRRSSQNASRSSTYEYDGDRTKKNFILAPPIQGLERACSFVSIRNWFDSVAFKTMSDETKFHVLARTAGILANDHERGFCSGGLNPSKLLISPQGDVRALDEEYTHSNFGNNDGFKAINRKREILYETLPSEDELPYTIKSELVTLGALVSEMFWKDMFDIGSKYENPREWFNEKEITHVDDLHPEMADTFKKLISRNPSHRLSAKNVRDIALKQLAILRNKKNSSSSPAKSSTCVTSLAVDRELNVDSERKANELKTILNVLKSIEKSRQRDYERTQSKLNVLLALSKLIPQNLKASSSSRSYLLQQHIQVEEQRNAKRKRNYNNDWVEEEPLLEKLNDGDQVVLDHVPFEDLPRIVFEDLQDTLFQAYAKSCNKSHALELAQEISSSKKNLNKDEKWISNMIKRTNVEDQLKDDLKEFSYCLTRVTRKWRFKVVARLGCGDLVGGSNDMVCSTAWNRDGDLFATAGISKRLCIYEVASVMQLGNAVHCPAIELSTSSKLSSISFNPYIKPVMASATYDGAMQIWDVQKGIETMRLKNHTKRVWSTEFSPIDPTRLLSASDDSTTRVWSITQRRECMVINDPNQANICSVNSSRVDSNLIAVGSADHKVHVYDLRNAVKPTLTLETHKKAVSYVRWMGNELVSASTDSLLRLWDVKGSKGICVRTYTGHVNEKNFVGLSVTSNGMIACGSEDNTVRMYAKFAPLPVAGHSFMRMTPGCGLKEGGPTEGLCGGIKPVLTNDKGAFVTSVAWSPDGQRLLASNSRGNLKIFELE